VRELFEEHFDVGEIDQLAELLGRLPGVVDGDDSCRAA
jgi:hypothetical protein